MERVNNNVETRLDSTRWLNRASSSEEEREGEENVPPVTPSPSSDSSLPAGGGIGGVNERKVESSGVPFDAPLQGKPAVAGVFFERPKVFAF